MSTTADKNARLCCVGFVDSGEGYGSLAELSFGYEHGTVTELTEVPDILARVCRTHRSSGRVMKSRTRTPGIVARACRTHRISGYGYMTVLKNSQKFRVRVPKCYRISRQACKCCTRIPCICGTGVQNVQKFLVRV